MPRATSLPRALPLLAVALAALGCAADRVELPVAPPPPPPPVGVPGLRLDVDYLPPALVVGARVITFVRALVGASANVQVPPIVWQTTNPAVLSIDQSGERFALLNAVSPGKATIIVSGGGATTRVDVEVYPQPEPIALTDSDVVIVRDFRFLTWGSQATGFSYVPLLRMAARSGPGFDVLAVRFSIPGVPPLHACSSMRPVGTGDTELFQESYGDWELEYTSTQQHDPGARVTAAIDVRDAQGAIRQLVIDGPIVPGGPPTTYSGGTFRPWSCG